MDFAKLFARVMNVLITPKTEWPVIAGEPATQASLLTGYSLLLAAVPAIFVFLKLSLIGIFGVLKLSVFNGLFAAALVYGVLIGVSVVVGLATNALAPGFGSTPDAAQGLKLGTYAMTPVYVAGILAAFMLESQGQSIFVWAIGFAYGAYLLTIGLPTLMKTPADKLWPYAGAVMGIGLITLIIGVVIARSIAERNIVSSMS